MGISKKHHYVPKALLRNFCVEGEATYYLSRRRCDREPVSRNIDSIFRRISYNTYLRNDGTKDDIVERFFAKELDNYIPSWTQVFENALCGGQLRFSSSEHRDRFIQFFYNHTTRTPDFVEPILQDVAERTFNNETINRFETEKRLLTDKEKRLFQDDEFRQRTLTNTRVENFSRQSLKILGRLSAMKIVVATPDLPNKQFIVASRPVARFEDYPHQELGEKGVEMWTTWTPRIAVGFVGDDSALDTMRLDKDNIRKLNRTLTVKSQSIAGKSKRLVSSLAKSAW